ncbi:MAG: RNA polymerase sigma factor [Candidatus Cryptobacteroides sp.]|nr:RNA polymerase sigma factor [Candidatus Cryptobacteroides sp.]
MTFYRTHARRLFNISMRILRDSGAAEDVMQETILKYLTSDIQPLGEAKAAAWLNKACIRSSIDALRKNKREQLSLNEYAASEQAVEAESQQEDMTDVEVGRVKKAMAELKDPYRLILNLVLIEGLDYDEIAEVTGQSQGTIRTQFSRGKVKLLEILKRYDGTK